MGDASDGVSKTYNRQLQIRTVLRCIECEITFETKCNLKKHKKTVKHKDAESTNGTYSYSI